MLVILHVYKNLNLKSTKFSSLSIAPPKALEGIFEPNNFLAHPEQLFKGKIIGPEHILERDGIFYASLANGDVVKIVDEKIEVMSKFGKFCREFELLEIRSNY